LKETNPKIQIIQNIGGVLLGDQITTGTRKVRTLKGINNADFETVCVLSSDTWLFVELWLKRQKKAETLAFWLQARRFSDAAKHECRITLVHFLNLSF